MEELLNQAASRAVKYLENINHRPVYPSPEQIESLDQFDIPLADQGLDPQDVLAILDEIGSPATVATAGSRYFGFVTGGALPATVAANWLAGAWDQNAGLVVGSPVTTRLEEVALKWLLDILQLPEGTGAGFVTGATMANFSGLAAARHALLARQGWDVEKQGLFGAPEIKVVVGDEVHASLLKSLQLVGFGSERITRVPVDDQGRILPDQLPELDDMTFLCIQAGNVNSGAFDPAEAICAKANQAGAWVHVDGAFGLWVRATKEKAHLTAGYELADSWAMDGHKWLNVPYDSGLIFCRDPQHLAAAMSYGAAYLIRQDRREPEDFTPEMSRRARGVEVWAALLSLGKDGISEMIERNCNQAQRMAAGLQEAGFDVVNEVVINQVAVAFGDDARTDKVIAALQEEGTFWAGGTTWQGRKAIRMSFSSWAITDEDVDKSLAAIKQVADTIN